MSGSESGWRRKQSREGKCERENKDNFRKSGHRLGKEYQAARRMSQQEREKPRERFGPFAAAEFQRGSFFFLSRGRSGRSGGGVGSAGVRAAPAPLFSRTPLRCCCNRP